MDCCWVDEALDARSKVGVDSEAVIEKSDRSAPVSVVDARLVHG